MLWWHQSNYKVKIKKCFSGAFRWDLLKQFLKSTTFSNWENVDLKLFLFCWKKVSRLIDPPEYWKAHPSMVSQRNLHLNIVFIQFQDAINGHLFLIKHLLILREQIAPFDVDFSVKEMSLDFSKMRTAAYGLWSHSNRLFALSSSNAILEFLLDVSML